MSFASHLRRLTSEETDPFLKGWEASARWFFQQAVKGADLSPAIAALETVFLEATQIGALRAAAAAIAAHDLRTGNAPHLAALAGKTRHPSSLLEGITDAADAGLPLAPALDLLLDLLRAGEHAVRPRPQRSRALAEPYQREHAAKALARHFVRTGEVEGLRSLLRHRRHEAVYMTASVLKEADLDLAPLLADLLGLLSRGPSIARDYASDAVERFAGRPGGREAVLAAMADQPKSEALAGLRKRIAKA